MAGGRSGGVAPDLGPLKKAARVPSAAQWAKRSYTVCHGPYRSGRSRHGDPSVHTRQQRNQPMIRTGRPGVRSAEPVWSEHECQVLGGWMRAQSTDPFFVDEVPDVVALYLDWPERAPALCAQFA